MGWLSGTRSPPKQPHSFREINSITAQSGSRLGQGQDVCKRPGSLLNLLCTQRPAYSPFWLRLQRKSSWHSVKFRFRVLSVVMWWRADTQPLQPGFCSHFKAWGGLTRSHAAATSGPGVERMNLLPPLANSPGILGRTQVKLHSPLHSNPWTLQPLVLLSGYIGSDL